MIRTYIIYNENAGYQGIFMYYDVCICYKPPFCMPWPKKKRNKNKDFDENTNKA